MCFSSRWFWRESIFILVKEGILIIRTPNWPQNALCKSKLSVTFDWSSAFYFKTTHKIYLKNKICYVNHRISRIPQARSRKVIIFINVFSLVTSVFMNRLFPSTSHKTYLLNKVWRRWWCVTFRRITLSHVNPSYFSDFLSNCYFLTLHYYI